MTLDAKLRTECEEFIGEFGSLLLSTLNPDGSPDLSYTPFVDHEGRFLILTSHLSAHTGNLINDARATILFIEDEGVCEQIYARRRLRFQCEAQRLAKEAQNWNPLIDLFAERFGGIIDTLRMLPDFELFALKPLGGQWVKGFGKAFNFDGRIQGDAIHLNPGKDRVQGR
ncbi:MAG TPA: pyridoxamine 5-phosphate oxidase [Gammaproteobacteria bacterium]|nr:pyridoxamine 5-phosphate oxidase [Gammaproteobacteria bacterium]|tara:strand:+ start:412 stop:921 length:510 start_codon:yes stop_codon:yes gene_type:complete